MAGPGSCDGGRSPQCRADAVPGRERTRILSDIQPLCCGLTDVPRKAARCKPQTSHYSCLFLHPGHVSVGCYEGEKKIPLDSVNDAVTGGKPCSGRVHCTRKRHKQTRAIARIHTCTKILHMNTVHYTENPTPKGRTTFDLILLCCFSTEIKALCD